MTEGGGSSDGSVIESGLFLRSLGIGKPVGAAATALSRAVSAVTVTSGLTLFAAGSPATWIDYIARGSVELRATDQVPWLFGPRDTIGVHDLFLERPRARTAVATSDVELFRVNCDEYIEVLEDNHDFTRALLSTVGAGLATMNAGAPAQPLSAPRNLLDRVSLLKACPAFSRARVQSLVDLAGVLTDTALDHGSLLTVRDQDRARITLVAQGRVEATLPERDGVVSYGPGMVIGGYARFADLVPDAMVSRGADTLLVHIELDDLYAIIDDHFDLARAMLAGIALEREATRDNMAG